MSLSSAHLTGLLTVGGPVTPQRAEQIRQDWRRGLLGRDVAFNPAILDYGPGHRSLEQIIRDGQNRFRPPEKVWAEHLPKNRTLLRGHIDAAVCALIVGAALVALAMWVGAHG